MTDAIVGVGSFADASFCARFAIPVAVVIPNKEIHMWCVGASFCRNVTSYFVPLSNAAVIDVAYDVV